MIKWSKEIYTAQKIIKIKDTEPWSNERCIVNRKIYSGFQLQYVNIDKLQK